jgi:metal-responsive CopG/Arc/MetJ family transcriptional regulator
MKRGAVTKSNARMINVWFPKPVMPLMDRGVQLEDSDRSKFIRRAVRERLERMGIPTLEGAGR